MRILVEILHPAHVHFFRHFIVEMERRGHAVLVTARDKDVTLPLLEAYGIPHRMLSTQRTGALGLARELVGRTRALLPIIDAFQPDVLTGIMGPTIALAGRWKRIPVVVFYDTETARFTNPWVYRLADVVCTPAAYAGPVPGRHVTYSGYHDLAYLHPNRFTPDPRKLQDFGLDPRRPFALARFVSFQASHDLGDRGLSHDARIELLDYLSGLGEVVVSSEGPIPEGLPARRLSGPPHEIHHVLAAARLLVGDSGTMSSEAAVLGTPAVFVSTARLSVLLDLERRYGLMANVPSVTAADAVAACLRLHSTVETGEASAARARLLAETVDLTDWMVEHFEQTMWRRG